MLTCNIQRVNQLPVSFNFSDTQERGETQIDGSFWANSLIHGSNSRNYYVAAHIMSYASDIPGAKPVYRAAILDISDPSFYANYVKIAPDNTTFWESCGQFNATLEGLSMESINPKDPLDGIRIWSSREGVEFDLTFKFSSPVLLNGALASYLVGGAIGYEWSLPKGITEGWLKVGNETIHAVPKQSSTWYDRQWASLQDSFQWFMLQFEDSHWLRIDVMSIWDWTDAVNGPKKFATIRDPKTGRDSVVPMTLIPSKTNVWTSPKTGISYPSEWLVLIEDFEILITTPRPDQVFETEPGTGFPSQFSGYVDAVAKKSGKASVRGWGASDVMTI